MGDGGCDLRKTYESKFLPAFVYRKALPTAIAKHLRLLCFPFFTLHTKRSIILNEDSTRTTTTSTIIAKHFKDLSIYHRTCIESIYLWDIIYVDENVVCRECRWNRIKNIGNIIAE